MHVAAPTPEHRAIDLHDGVADPVVVPVVLGCCLGQASAAERAHRVQIWPGGEVGGKVLSVTVGRDMAGSEAELHNTPSGPVIGTSPGTGPSCLVDGRGASANRGPHHGNRLPQECESLGPGGRVPAG